MKLNWDQHAILVLGLLLFITAGLFPPWVRGDGSYWESAGPQWVLTSDFDGRIDTTRLFIIWLIIIVGTAVMMLLFRGASIQTNSVQRRPASDQSNSPPPSPTQSLSPWRAKLQPWLLLLLGLFLAISCMVVEDQRRHTGHDIGMIGGALTILAALSELWPQRRKDTPHSTRRATIMWTIVVVIAVGIIGWLFAYVWREVSFAVVRADNVPLVNSDDKQAHRSQPDVTQNLDYPPSDVAAELLRRGMVEDAIKLLRTVVESQPADTRAHFLLGMAYVESDQVELALQQYQILTRLDLQAADELYAIAQSIR